MLLNLEHQTGAPGRRRPVSPPWASRWLGAAANLYFVAVFGWKVLHALAGDRWWWLFLLNSFAPLLFLPLPALPVIALVTRRRTLWLGSAAVLGLWLVLYGDLFLPHTGPAPPGGPTLTVMTWNVLGFNEATDGVVAAVRRSGADVVALQELNPAVARALHQELADQYPYQALDPQPGVTGMGVLSRYPLRSLAVAFPDGWVGRPQVLALDLAGQPVTLVNFHAVPPLARGRLADSLRYSVAERERQAVFLVGLAADHPGPLLVLGDLNATEQSTAYAGLRQTYRDAWREAGRGFGHTFPGAASPGSSTASIAGIQAPMWLVRIDYVFHSAHWRTAAAWIGPWDGVADHRPVMAQVSLVSN